MALNPLFREWCNSIWSCSADSGSASCALVPPLLSPDLSMCTTSALEIRLGSQMLLKIAAQIPCLLFLASIHKMRCASVPLAKSGLILVFYIVKYSGCFESWQHTKWLAATASWNQALCLLNLQTMTLLSHQKVFHPSFPCFVLILRIEYYFAALWPYFMPSPCTLLSMNFGAVSAGSFTAQRSLCCPKWFAVLALYLWSLTCTLPPSMFFCLVPNLSFHLVTVTCMHLAAA